MISVVRPDCEPDHGDTSWLKASATIKPNTAADLSAVALAA
jgi:hypothetical protein